MKRRYIEVQARSTKSRVVRGAKRASYNSEQITGILDASLLCHVGFTVDGEARVIPTAYVRMDNAIYIHGNLHNQMINALLDGQTACVTVTLIDGLVLARSAFHHSVNYRSVVLFAKAELVQADEKSEVLDALIEHFVPGRSADLRSHEEKELKATLLLKLTIEEASAKVRTGPPVDVEKDYSLNTWAGVLNLNSAVSSVEPCPRLSSSVEIPKHVTEFINPC